MKNLFKIAVLAAAASQSAFAKIEMGAPFSGGAVLQRGMEVPVWGRGATPGGKVRVAFAGQEKTAVSGGDGSWKVVLDAMEASKAGRTVSVKDLASGETVEIEDVLVGEVWFASGQSNMECPIWGTSARYRDMKGGLMVAMTSLPCVRYVKVDRKWSVEPCGISAKWNKFTPEGLQIFHRIETGVGGGTSEGISLSAVAFYYARELYLALDVPVGIVDASWGGTSIDAWTPRSGYDGCDASIRAAAEYPVKKNWNADTDKRYPVTWEFQQPTVLYNGMVAAFAPMAIRGFIWYQGCSNWNESGLYCAKLHALYNGWRREFCNPGLKMYLVQLAPYSHNWLEICMAQTKFCAEEKNAALAVAADAGNFRDIHPNDKEIVAKRLAVHALKRDYGFEIPEDDSPVVKSVSFADGTARVVFDNVKEWYVYSPDRAVNPAFELAGTDGKWHPAKIRNFRKKTNRKGETVDSEFIDGPEIVLASEMAPQPAKVRYMGRPRTSGTLYNEASLPLGPFAAGGGCSMSK